MQNEFNHQQSMEIITSMIQKTRHQLKISAFDYLFWGWLAFISAALQYILLQFERTMPYAYLTWAVMMTFGGIFSGIYHKRKSKELGYESHISYLLKYLWLAFIVFVFIILAHSFKTGWTGTQTLIIAMYGLGIFLSGIILKFKPMIIGGISGWLLSLLGLYLPYFSNSAENTVLLVAISIVITYLIPGYLLKNSKDYV
jgi:uncharacterized membrane protein YhaH (DUF805 family)